MELIIKHFSELTTTELMEIYQLRNAVFVVEQNCVYQDVDGCDPVAYHLYLKDEDGISNIPMPPWDVSSPSSADKDWPPGSCRRVSRLPEKSSAQNG